MTRRELPLDAVAILRLLGEHGVDYVVIGGLAVQAHGNPRTTQDLDLVPAPGRANIDRLAKALEALHARPVGERAAGPWHVRIPGAGVLELDTDAGGVDVHIDPPGAAMYSEMRARSLALTIDGVRLFVAGRDDLISMKRASRRPIDRADILALTEPEPLP